MSPTFLLDFPGDYVVQLIVNDGTMDSAPDSDYVIQLIVNDGTGNSAPDTVIISSNNVAPVANAGPDQGGKAPGSLITLTAAQVPIPMGIHSPIVGPSASQPAAPRF